jgi:hypothetical protein
MAKSVKQPKNAQKKELRYIVREEYSDDRIVFDSIEELMEAHDSGAVELKAGQDIEVCEVIGTKQAQFNLAVV